MLIIGFPELRFYECCHSCFSSDCGLICLCTGAELAVHQCAAHTIILKFLPMSQNSHR